MKLVYMGGGFVGACSAAVMADAGHDVTVFDISTERIQKLSSGDADTINSCLHEEQLAEYIIRNASRLSFIADPARFATAAGMADAIFLCLPTPEDKKRAGQSDLSYYRSGITQLGQALVARDAGKQEKYIVIVNKSTVPVKTVNLAKELLAAAGVINVGVVSNPEFLVEGKAIEDSVRPSRIVVGAETKKDFELMRKVYERWLDVPRIAYLEVNPFEAAAGKLLANYVLFNRVINCYSVVGRLSEQFSELRFEELRRIISSDPRIGTWGWYDSVYAGGSCFIKDAASLAYQLEEAGAPADMVRLSLALNRGQLERFYTRITGEAGFVPRGKRVAFLGAAFKQMTNDVRESGAIGLAELFLADGVEEIRVYDPAAAGVFLDYWKSTNSAYAQKIHIAHTPKEAWNNADATCIVTDWQEFKGMAEQFMETARPPHLIADGRRMWVRAAADLRARGFTYLAVGSAENA